MVLSPLLIQGIEVNLPKTDTTKMTVQSEPLVISINSIGEIELSSLIDHHTKWFNEF